MTIKPATFDAAIGFGAAEFGFLALYVAAVLLIPRHATITRLASVVALSALTFIPHHAFFRWCSNPHWRGFAAAAFPVQLLSASEIILRRDLALTAGNNGVGQVINAISFLWNLRRVGTTWQVKNVSVAFYTRLEFIRSRITTTLIAYIMLDALLSGPSPRAALIAPDKQTLLINRLSADDIVFRIAASLLYWFSSFLIILIVSNTLAITLVLTGLSSPVHHPPLFGPITDAYTIRNFWNSVWHQCLRSGLTFHANLLADKVLRLPRRTPLSRYTRIFACFFISAIIHVICERGIGVPSDEGGAMLFFPAQTFGIMMEDGAQWFVGKRFRQRGMSRAVGYIWVAAFLVWMSPVWCYPLQRVDTGPSLLLPLSVVRPSIGLLERFW